MGRAMLHLAIVFAEMERERTLVGLERVKATGKYLGRRKGVSRKRAEEIQNMRRCAGLSWGRIATISGSTSAPFHGRAFEYRRVGLSGRRICLRLSSSSLARIFFGWT